MTAISITENYSQYIQKLFARRYAVMTIMKSAGLFSGNKRCAVEEIDKRFYGVKGLAYIITY